MSDWPLVGRDEELDLLEAAQRERAAGVVLAGTAGVGKTRLAVEAIDRARADGAATTWTTATRSLATIPFGVFAHLLPVGVDPRADPLELFRQAQEGLEGVAADAPRLVLGIDDAHLLDAGSAALLHHIAATRVAFVLLTIRTGEPAPDAITALTKDGLATRIELQPLAATETAAVLDQVLGGAVEQSTARRLWERSGGNALFLRELVRSGLDDGALTDDLGVWSWRGELAPTDRLKEVVQGRVGDLDESQRDALEVAAVAEPIGVDLLAELTSARALVDLERRGLLTVAEDRRRRPVRLAHPLYGEVVRADMGALRLAEIQRSLGDQLTRVGARRREDLLRQAVWRLEGGGDVDVDLLIAAARRAGALADHPLAERLATAALDHGGGAAAANELGESYYWRGRYDEAVAAHQAAVAQASEGYDLLQAAIRGASAEFFGRGDPTAAFAAVDAGLAAIDEPVLRAELEAYRAELLVLHGRTSEAVEVTQGMLAAPVDDRSRTRALAAGVLSLAASGRCDAAHELAGPGLELAQRMADELPTSAGGIVVGDMFALWVGGRLRDLVGLAETLYQMSIARPADNFRGVWTFFLGRAHLEAGHPVTAARQLREAEATLRELDAGQLLPWCRASQAHAAALLGDPDGDAEATIRDSDAVRTPAMCCWEPSLHLAEAWVCAARGETTRAQGHARHAATVAIGLEQPGIEALALHHAARLGVAGEVVGRLEDLTTVVEGTYVPALAAHAAALDRDDAVALDAAVDTFHELGADLLAAEAAAEAGEAHRRAGRTGSALASQTRARELAASCEGARTPALAALDEGSEVDRLTRREREVAELAARGATRREMAEQLYISMSTVTNHLNHVYDKLGVRSREELARALGR